jgi:hypothetical protein
MANTYRDVLFISEDYIKSESMLDDNVSGKYLLTAIKLAQDIELRSVIGKCLLETLQQKIFDREIDAIENGDYKDLLDVYIQPFLLYQVLSEIIIPTTYKMSNFGLMRSDDEKDYSVDNGQVNLIREFYMDKANVYKKRLQNYLCNNKALFPELDDCCEVNLYSSHNCGIWLGGERGKIVGKDCCDKC